jgi:aerobic carbon-monoxide dehydrogenase large subunit
MRLLAPDDRTAHADASSRGNGAPSSQAAPFIGRPLRRVEDERMLRGEGRFVDDHQPPGCLHVAFLRSPHARARIVSLQKAEAEAAAGVVLVATGADLAGMAALPVNQVMAGMMQPPFAVIAADEAASVGDAMAAVVAQSVDAARDATELIEIEFEPIDAVTAPALADAARPALAGTAANAMLAQSWREGDVGSAFASAAATAALRITQPRLSAVALEPRAALASWDSDKGELTAWLSTQTPHRARADLARLLDLDEARVRVISRDVGGAFGAKASIYPEDIFVAWASIRLGRPVKWVATRGEDLLATAQGRGAVMEGEIAVAADGRLLALRADIAFPLGRFLTYSAAVPAWNAGRILPGPYLAQAIDVSVRGVLTNTAPVGIYRGAGRPEAAMLMERLMDEAARGLGMDPVEIRRRNLIPPDRFPYRSPTGQVFDSGVYRDLLDRVCDEADYVQACARQGERRARGEHVGIGIAFYVEPCGQGWESARARLLRDGRAEIATGSSAQGQGRETAFAQIAADALGIPFEAIAVSHGDTAVTPKGIGALASRSTAIGGSAVLRAATALRTKVLHCAAQLLQARVADLVQDADGFALAGDRARRIGWQAIAAAAQGPLDASVVFAAPGETWSSGCCFAAVAIDGDTGELRIERLVWGDDAGVIVNPLLAEGQLIGGMAQGFGQAVMERIVYDESGQLLTGSLMDYALPRAADMPEVVTLNSVTPATVNPLGAKGVGEAGCIGIPAAIVNAAVDALAPLGVRHLDMPLTSDKLWRIIQGAARGEKLWP